MSIAYCFLKIIVVNESWQKPKPLQIQPYLYLFESAGIRFNPFYSKTLMLRKWNTTKWRIQNSQQIQNMSLAVALEGNTKIDRSE